MRDETMMGQASFEEIYSRLAKVKEGVGFRDMQSVTENIKWYKDARKNPDQARQEDADLFNSMGDYESLSDEQLEKIISMLEAK